MSKSPDPKDQPYQPLLAEDGTPLSPVKPSRGRKMLEDGVAFVTTDAQGRRVLQMKRRVGRVVSHA